MDRGGSSHGLSTCPAGRRRRARARGAANAEAHPADCAGAAPFASAPVAVSFADWTVDCTHARGAADSDVEIAASSLEGIATSSEAAPAPAVSGGRRGEFEQVGHEPLMNRGMNAAIAVHRDYAYIGSRTDGGHAGQPQGGIMVVDISEPDDPEALGPPLDPVAGESTRELRVWRSQDMLIVLNTNCGVGDQLHHCTQPSISNIRFYDIGGRDAERAAAAAPVRRRHARVLPVGGPAQPAARADLRRQRELHLRHARRLPQLPVLGLGHLAGALREGAGDPVQRALPVLARPGDGRAGRQADGRPALAHDQQRRPARVLRAADRRVRDRRRVGLRGREGVAEAAGDHGQRCAARVGGPGRAQRRQALGPRLGVGLRRGLRDRHRRRPRLPVGLGADDRHLRPRAHRRSGPSTASRRTTRRRARLQPAADVVLGAQPDAHAARRVQHLALGRLPGGQRRATACAVPAGGVHAGAARRGDARGPAALLRPGHRAEREGRDVELPDREGRADLPRRPAQRALRARVPRAVRARGAADPVPRRQLEPGRRALLRAGGEGAAITAAERSAPAARPPGRAAVPVRQSRSKACRSQ